MELCLNMSLNHNPNAKIQLWLNPNINPSRQADGFSAININDVKEAEARLLRFAPLLMQRFPQLVPDEGLIESPLLAIGVPNELQQPQGRFWVKGDHQLAIAGSIKARGGIHEVLEFVESLARQQGLLDSNTDYRVLLQPKAQAVLQQYQVVVGSTGNLGLSIGLIAAALGLTVTVHMSIEAKQWKKTYLRQHGVQVIEHQGDYAKAVAVGRAQAQANPYAHFVDDERSTSLFAGYAVAASRLQAQLSEHGVQVDAQHPLFVYLPCGVGGAPGGVAYGLKAIYGPHVHCFFVEPQQSSCFAVQLQHLDQPNISIYEVGQTNHTEADGLAVPVASQLAIAAMRTRLSGVALIDDAYLLADLYALYEQEGIQVEPSAAAAYSGVRAVFNTAEGRHYIQKNGLVPFMQQANHILWTTGGALVPENEYQHWLERGKQISTQLFAV